MVAAGATVCDPVKAIGPLQPPDALHDVAFDADQLKVVLLPAAIELGLAEIAAVGADPETVTVTDLEVEPPAPEQAMV